MKWRRYLLISLFLISCQEQPEQTVGFEPENVFKVGRDTWQVETISFTPNQDQRRKTLYFDPQTKLKLTLFPKELHTFQSQQITQEFNFRSTGYCEVFTLEAKAIDKPQIPIPSGCQPWYVITINDSFVAQFPLIYPDIQAQAEETQPVNTYRVYAPCSNACDVPLNIKVTKRPGANCSLSKDGLYLNLTPEIVESTFQTCPAPVIPPLPSGVKLYHPRSLQKLLDSAENQIDVVEAELQTIITEAQALFPDIGEPPSNSNLNEGGQP